MPYKKLKIIKNYLTNTSLYGIIKTVKKQRCHTKEGRFDMAKFNIYEEITNRIIEQLESGVIPWHKPWHGLTSGAYNRVTKKPYSLLNQMLLKHDGEYATYKQWTEAGGKVKKGEKAEIVVFWKILDVDEVKNGRVEKKSIPLLKYINVFHVSQIDGVEPKNIKPVEHKPVEEAEKIKNEYSKRENIKIKEVVSNEAFYSPVFDYIQVPCKEQYNDVFEFYGTLFHEMIHSTGHKDRLKRLDCGVQFASFGSEDYSKEKVHGIDCNGSRFQFRYASAFLQRINNLPTQADGPYQAVFPCPNRICTLQTWKNPKRQSLPWQQAQRSFLLRYGGMPILFPWKFS